MGKILQLFGNEAQLVRALRGGDPKAQRLLYEKFSGKMMAVCTRYVGDRSTAEDILVQGFMKIFDSVLQFREQGSFEGWMRRIMVNEALGYLRQQKRLFERVGIEEASAVPDYDLADQYLQVAEIMEMIERLPFGYRTVFNLYAIEGFSHQEIADMLGITESTSKSQLHRARAQLQLMISKWEVISRREGDSNFKNNQSTSN
jgi:RNA polymerase sigma factor (sigma-70 family)